MSMKLIIPAASILIILGLPFSGLSFGWVFLVSCLLGFASVLVVSRF